MYDPNDPNTWVAVPPTTQTSTDPFGWLNFNQFPTDNLGNAPEVANTSSGVSCCGQEAKWVNNGIGFRYWLCKVCWKEVEHSDNDPVQCKNDEPLFK